MADFGYDISDYRDIDPIFGTMEDFETLAAEAKARGLRIIMDFVPNHSSNQHEWFLRSEAREEPYTDYYIWRDAKEMNSSNFSMYDLSYDSYLVSKVSYLITDISPDQLVERVPRFSLGVERDQRTVLLPRLHQVRSQSLLLSSPPHPGSSRTLTTGTRPWSARCWMSSSSG